MATIRWVGGAAKTAQVNDYVFGAGPWVIGEKITVTVGQKQLVYTLASAVIDTEAAALVTAYNGLTAADYPEMAEMTASYAAATNKFTLTANTAGKSFLATLSTNSAAGTIDGGASSAGTVSTANGGPQSLASPKNYSGGALPVSTDTLIFDYLADEILYDLDVLSGVTLTLRHVYASFTGKIGLPLTNTDGTPYPEYRPRYMVCHVTTDMIGEGEGQGSQRLMFDYGSVQTTVNVLQSDTGEQSGNSTLPAVMLKGTHASNVLNVTKGSVGCDVFGGESTTILTLNMSFENDAAGDANVFLGPAVTLGTVSKVGGILEINSAVGTALTQDGGQTTINGTGAVAQLTIRGGTVVYNTTGALNGATVISGDGLLDFDQDKRAKTVTNPIDLFGNDAGVWDSNKVVPDGTLILDFNESSGGNMKMGKNFRLTRGAVA